MKNFQAILVLAAGASASVVQQRDVARVTDIMTPVLNQLRAYDSLLQCFFGGDTALLVGTGNALLATAQAANGQAMAMPALGIDDAKAFKPLSDELDKAGDAVMADLGAKLGAFEQARICGYIAPFVKQLGDTIGTLAKTVDTKFPASIQASDSSTINHFHDGFAKVDVLLAGCVDGAFRSGRRALYSGNATACIAPVQPVAQAEPTIPHDTQPAAQPATQPASQPATKVPAQPILQAPAALPTGGMARNASQSIVTAGAPRHHGSVGWAAAAGTLAFAAIVATFF